MTNEKLFSDTLVDENEPIEEKVVICWKDHNRVCGDECAAFDGRIEQDERFRPCLLLNLERQNTNTWSNISGQLAALSRLFQQYAEKGFRQKLQQEIEKLPKPPEIR